MTNLMRVVRDKAEGSRAAGDAMRPATGRGAKCCRTHLPNETQMDFLPGLFTQPKRMGQIVKGQAHLSILLLNIITL